MNPQKKRLSIWSSAILVCLLAACSRSSNSAQSNSSPPPINPCSVLSPADIKAVLGTVPRASGTREDLGPIDKCSWSLPGAGDVYVTFYDQVGPASFMIPSVSPRNSDDKTYDAITGLGDQAVYRDKSSVVNFSKTVEVVKGKRHFDVTYVDAFTKASGPSKNAMVSLAGTVLAHAR